MESVISVYVMSTVWEGTDGCAKQYMCALAKYLITVLSYSYSIVLDRANSSPWHGKNVVDGINTKDKSYLKGEMKFIRKL